MHPKFATCEGVFKRVPEIFLIDDIPNLINLTPTNFHGAKIGSPHHLKYFRWASSILMTTVGDRPQTAAPDRGIDLACGGPTIVGHRGTTAQLGEEILGGNFAFVRTMSK